MKNKKAVKKSPVKKATKKAVKKPSVKKPVKKSVKKELGILDTIKRNKALVAAGLAIPGLIGAKFIYDKFSKIKSPEISIGLHPAPTIESYSSEVGIPVVIKSIYNPSKKLEWEGYQLLSVIFLREYLIKKYSSVMCTSLKGKSKYVDTNDTLIKKEDSEQILHITKDGVIKILEDGIKVIDYSNKDTANYIGDLIYDNCRDKRFFILPLYIIGGKQSHATTLVFDRNNKTVHHYDPYGGRNYIVKISETLTDIIKKVDPKLVYIDVKKVCPYKGIQKIASDTCKHHNNINFQKDNLCIVWNLILIEERLKRPDAPIGELLEEISKSGELMCDFVLGYAQTITTFSENFKIAYNSFGIPVEYYKKKQ